MSEGPIEAKNYSFKALACRQGRDEDEDEEDEDEDEEDEDEDEEDEAADEEDEDADKEDEEDEDADEEDEDADKEDEDEDEEDEDEDEEDEEDEDADKEDEEDEEDEGHKASTTSSFMLPLGHRKRRRRAAVRVRHVRIYGSAAKARRHGRVLHCMQAVFHGRRGAQDIFVSKL